MASQPTLLPLPPMQDSHSRSDRRLPAFRSASSPRTPTSSSWERPPMRQYVSVNALQSMRAPYASSAHSTAPSSSRHTLAAHPLDYAHLVHLLLSVLSPRAEEWDVLSASFWDSLEDDEWDEAPGSRQGELVEWAYAVAAMAKGDSTARPRIPAFLLAAARGQVRPLLSRFRSPSVQRADPELVLPRAQDPTMSKRVAQEARQAMLSVQSKAIEAVRPRSPCST